VPWVKKGCETLIYLTTLQRLVMQLLLNNDLERIWKKEVVAYFDMLSDIFMDEPGTGL
jgi:hypothetical protein